MFGQLSKKEILSLQVWGLYTARDWRTSSSGKWHDNSQHPGSHLVAPQDVGSASHVGLPKHMAMSWNTFGARLARIQQLIQNGSRLPFQRFWQRMLLSSVSNHKQVSYAVANRLAASDNPWVCWSKDC